MHSTGRCNTLESAQAEEVLRMKQRPRVYYTESQKLVMWEHWRKGDSLHQIAQLFDRNHSSIQRILADRRYSTRAGLSILPSVVFGRAGRNFLGPGPRSIDSLHRHRAQACSLNPQQRDQAQWQAVGVPRQPGRSSDVRNNGARLQFRSINFGLVRFPRC